MNSTYYSNSSNFINSSNVPLCEGLGIFCPYLYNRRHVIAYFTTVGNIIIIPFILYLIFTKVTDGFFKYFTLNLMFVCVTSAIAALITDAINITKLFISITESKLHLSDIQKWSRFYVRLGSIWFHVLTLYAVIICYLPYVKPFFYSKKFSNRSQKPYYVALHISALIWSTSVTYLFTEFKYRIPYFLTHITLFISLFFAALIGLLKINKYKPLGVDSIRVAKAQQKRLYSFILYSYSIEFITLPMFINACAHAFCIFAGCESNFLASYFKMILNLIIYYFYEMRSIAIITITILALEPYRRATFSLFSKEH